MLKIILKNGRELLNDPELGLNLESKEEIEENLSVTGRYDLCTSDEGFICLSVDEIKDII
ncbi:MULTISPECIES: hypothetical protein [Bacillus]|uniref:Uncharacterized protein n=1 Tax=Bacillus glycinifermentans TaxID=1664069 RepID=A0A0T6BMJ0_9BACI|nr:MULTISPECIES: hypothetical protein [Bacillus]ATH91637.1 hypothetical protein COP00_02640 [Bacillus glycinifermentans]KRT92714.1 hypothetical protein AB447_222300 [Bacillus glycinifermentans]MDU0072096.1 hypothetical protein [Bacillus sp. IG6]MEC0483414.1 hypothetical protein [Bacillus glycinifermentans]MED8019645.1 hypothetical protein [Bacillus glycinifermentans]